MTAEDDERKAFKALQGRLQGIWEDVHNQPRAPHSCLVIPSLSFDQEELQKVTGVPFYEERLMFMLMNQMFAEIWFLCGRLPTICCLRLPS